MSLCSLLNYCGCSSAVIQNCGPTSSHCQLFASRIHFDVNPKSFMAIESKAIAGFLQYLQQ